VIAVGISAIPWYARVVRGTVMVEHQTQYFEAAKSLGADHQRLVTRHILPNALPPILVLATLGFSTAVLSAAALSFLGLGAQPPTPEWGLELASVGTSRRRGFNLSDRDRSDRAGVQSSATVCARP
jgi:peptide/nickel transport system permease protein